MQFFIGQAVSSESTRVLPGISLLEAGTNVIAPRREGVEEGTAPLVLAVAVVVMVVVVVVAVMADEKEGPQLVSTTWRGRQWLLALTGSGRARKTPTPCGLGV